MIYLFSIPNNVIIIKIKVHLHRLYTTAHYWLGTRTSIKSGGVKQLVLAQANPLSDIISHEYSHMTEDRDININTYT
jgi:hypothetical protein